MHAPAIAKLDLSGEAVEVDLVVRGEGRKSDRKKSAQRLAGGGSAPAGFRKRQGGCPRPIMRKKSRLPEVSMRFVICLFSLLPTLLGFAAHRGQFITSTRCRDCRMVRAI